MSRLYNEEVKNRYLETYDNIGTQSTIKHIFMKAADTEDSLNKDLYNFSTDDLIYVFKEIKPKSKTVSESAGRFIKQYISWCIRNGYRDNNDNPLNGVDKDWFSQFVDRKTKIHYSYEEFIELIEDMQGQDAGFLALIFEGVLGRSFSQIRNLKKSDINFDTNEIYIEERDDTMVVSEMCMNYLQKAIDQSTYYTYNKETDEHNERPLVESEVYVFRNVQSPRTTTGVINPSVLYSRLQHIKDEQSLEHLTPNGIKQSGMIWQSVQIYERDKSFGEYKQFEEIGMKYHYTTVKAPSGEYFNTTLMREFLNSDKIEELYGITIQF